MMLNVALNFQCMKAIMKFLPHVDVLKIRTLNRFCNKLFQHPEILNLTQFVLDGSTPKNGHRSIQAFLDSSVLWTNIKFNKFDTEKGLLGHLPLFSIFTRKFGHTMKSLTF